MPFPSETFLDLVRSAYGVIADELQNLYAQIEGYMRTQHNADGSHSAITATSVTTTGTVSGNIATFSSTTGRHTFGSLSILASPLAQEVRYGTATTGWETVVESQTGIDASGNGWRLFNRAVDTALPVVQVAYYSLGAYHWLQAHTGGGLALGHKDGTSGDRILYLAVQDIYERGRATPMGDWASYTPTFAASGSQPTNYTATGTHTRVGGTVIGRALVIAGVSWTAGTGTYSITLPVTSAALPATAIPIGTAVLWDASTDEYWSGVVKQTSTTTAVIIPDGSRVYVGAAVPFAFAASDQIGITFQYPAA